MFINFFQDKLTEISSDSKIALYISLYFLLSLNYLFSRFIVFRKKLYTVFDVFSVLYPIFIGSYSNYPFEHTAEMLWILKA